MSKTKNTLDKLVLVSPNVHEALKIAAAKKRIPIKKMVGNILKRELKLEEY